jgi:hypothetical protein
MTIFGKRPIAASQGGDGSFLERKSAMNLKLLLIPVFILLRSSESIEFSQTDWTNPSQPGSSLWLKNGRAKPVIVESVFVRNIGFQTSDEIALSAGKTRYFFKAGKAKQGQWIRLDPKGKMKKIRLRARDSLMVHGFEYGSRLKAKKQSKVLSEEYVLDLKLVDNTGDSSIVKVSESAPKYYIHGNPDGTDSGPKPE